jgi:hypothetical protein
MSFSPPLLNESPALSNLPLASDRSGFCYTLKGSRWFDNEALDCKHIPMIYIRTFSCVECIYMCMRVIIESMPYANQAGCFPFSDCASGRGIRLKLIASKWLSSDMQDVSTCLYRFMARLVSSFLSWPALLSKRRL